jgi:hypothetical protein
VVGREPAVSHCRLSGVAAVGVVDLAVGAVAGRPAQRPCVADVLRGNVALAGRVSGFGPGIGNSTRSGALAALPGATVWKE